MDLEVFAHSKFPKRGRCPRSPFANGWHRAGTIPVESVLDGGLPGDVLQEICLHCERRFSQRWFLPKNQPSLVGAKQ